MVERLVPASSLSVSQAATIAGATGTFREPVQLTPRLEQAELCAVGSGRVARLCSRLLPTDAVLHWLGKVADGQVFDGAWSNFPGRNHGS